MCASVFEKSPRVIVSIIEGNIARGRSFVPTAEILSYYDELEKGYVKWILTDETKVTIDKWIDSQYLLNFPKSTYQLDSKHTSHSTDIRKHYELSSERHPEVRESVHRYIIENSVYKKYEKNWSYTIPDGPHKGKVLYSGRYATVSCVVYTIEDGFKYVLATERGKGCPDYVGYLNIVNGYIEGNETAELAVIREIHEETGLELDINDLKFEGVESRPDKCNNGNISLHYSIYVEPAIAGKTNTNFSEKDEVADIKWIDVYSVDQYKWAFNNKELINKVCRK